MKKWKSEKNRYVLLMVVLFVLSRIFVLTNPPYKEWVEDGELITLGYSDVKHDSERYANMWKYGMTPYLEHLYEYPPGAIPLVYLPLEVDLWGLGNYYLNYRVGIFLLELLFFLFLAYGLQKAPIKSQMRTISLLFYIGAGVLAKDYWYDGLDLIFAMFLATAVLWRYVRGHKTLFDKAVFWMFYWLSTAVKYMTLPLALPFFMAGRLTWKKEILAGFLGFLIVWLIPLAIFRTSLSVSVVFHLQRPLKYNSFGSFVVRTINDYTDTEEPSNLAPHFPVIGPISTQMERIVGITFPIAMLTIIGMGTYVVYRSKDKYPDNDLFDYQLLIRVSLAFFLVLFLTTKVLSSPFHIWYVPFIAMFPFAKLKQQLVMMVLALWMLGLDTTPYIIFPDTWIANIYVPRIRDALRFIPMMGMLLMLTKLSYAKQK